MTMPDLMNLNYSPLTARPSQTELAEFRTAHEMFDYDEEAAFDTQQALRTKGDSQS